MTLAFNNISVLVFFKAFLGLSLAMFYTVVVLMDLTDFVLPRKLSNDSERRAQVSTCSSLRSTIAGSTLIILKKSRFVEEVLF